MSTRRKQAIAAQAAAVAVLVLFVYLTLLAPEGIGPLFGIEAPPGEERTQVQEPGNRGDGEGGDESSGGGTGTSGPVSGTGSGAAISSVAGGNVGGAGASDGFAGAGAPDGSAPDGTRFVNTPRRDQYGDAVEVLLRKVGDPSPPGE